MRNFNYFKLSMFFAITTSPCKENSPSNQNAYDDGTNYGIANFHYFISYNLLHYLPY